MGSLDMYGTVMHDSGYSSGVSKRSTVALLCYFLPWWCYFSFLVMKDAARRVTHGATATVTCATAKSSLDTPELDSDSSSDSRKTQNSDSDSNSSQIFQQK